MMTNDKRAESVELVLLHFSPCLHLVHQGCKGEEAECGWILVA